MRKLIYGDRYEACCDGTIVNAKTGRVLSPGVQSKGYRTVQLYDGSSPKKPRSFLVHRLVAHAFIKPLERDEEVDHRNGAHSDNRVENLRVLHYVEHGRMHPCVAYKITELGRKSGFLPAHLRAA